MGRKNPEAADRLAFALIETSKRVMDVVPQLTLRYYKGMNEELMVKTLENIEAGAVYPIVYSDETVVPSCRKHMESAGKRRASGFRSVAASILWRAAARLRPIPA